MPNNKTEPQQESTTPFKDEVNTAVSVPAPAGVGTSSQSDVLKLTDYQAGRSPLDRLAEFSGEVEKFTQFGNITEGQHIAIMSLAARDEYLRTGDLNIMQWLWGWLAFRNSVGGQGRRDYLEGMGAAVNRENKKWGIWDSIKNQLSGNKTDRNHPTDHGAPV